MQPRHSQRHIDLQAERQPHVVLACDRLGLLDMRDAIHHQRDARAIRRRPRHRRQIVGMPGGIADEQVVESLACQPGRLTRRETHQPAKDGTGRQDAPQRRHTAHRLRGDAHMLVAGFPDDGAYVFIQQVEVEPGERHRVSRECAAIVVVIARGGASWRRR